MDFALPLQNIDFESLKIILSSESSLDSSTFLGPFKDREESYRFFLNYGFDLNDPIENSELFGIFQEALQFIKRYFLISGNEDGLDLVVPNIFYTITDIGDLSLISSRTFNENISDEEAIWASIIIKVMHTILHADKDLRYHYFTTIQTQIFDRFYKYLHRDENDDLYLKSENSDDLIPLIEFETKANKSRESTIIKLLHKKENVAEELFDRIGVRLITKNKLDVLRVINFLKENHIIISNNIKPSRTVNTMFDADLLDNTNNLSEKKVNSFSYFESDNEHSSKKYCAVHFTSRQLIKYQNPFLKELNAIRQLASKEKESELAKKILTLDTKQIAQSIRFFYPFEVQITDKKSHLENTKGEASHGEYKKQQLNSAMNRLFSPLLNLQEKS